MFIKKQKLSGTATYFAAERFSSAAKLFQLLKTLFNRCERFLARAKAFEALKIRFSCCEAFLAAENAFWQLRSFCSH